MAKTQASATRRTAHDLEAMEPENEGRGETGHGEFSYYYDLLILIVKRRTALGSNQA